MFNKTVILFSSKKYSRYSKGLINFSNIKKELMFLLLMFSLVQSNAQQSEFKDVVKEIEVLLFKPDTALFDDEKISYAKFYKNGNVELANINDEDTTRFNLHYLHNINMDDDSTYNRFGLHLSESSVQLFLDPVMNEIGLNEEGELISKGSMLAFFSITLQSPKKAKQLTDALISLRAITTPDDNGFIRKY